VAPTATLNAGRRASHQVITSNGDRCVISGGRKKNRVTADMSPSFKPTTRYMKSFVV
jgi:hypothetical protein